MNFRDTSQINKARSDEYYPECKKWTAADWATALTGELGELCNLLKKIKRLNDGTKLSNDLSYEELRRKIEKEIGDTFCYLDLLATHLDFDLETAIRTAFNEVSEREGFKYKLPY